MWLIIGIIIVLYAKTYRYKWLIDDWVPREEYLWTCPSPKEPEGFTNQIKPLSYTIVNIATYIGVCAGVYLCFGWKVALLYTVMPTNVSGVAWGRTGNYYMTTVLFCISAFYFGQFDWGLPFAIIFYACALESTVMALPFWLLGFYHSPECGMLMFIPFLLFVTGKRFQTGLGKRVNLHRERSSFDYKLSLVNFITAIEVVTYYLYLSLGFTPKGFFHTFGKDGEVGKLNKTCFVSILVFIAFTGIGLYLSPLGTIWFFLCIGVFSQFVSNLGQFITERYTPLAYIGICIILYSFIEQFPTAYGILIGAWMMESWYYIPAWRSNESLFAQGTRSFPTCPDNYVNLGSLYIDRNQYLKAITPLAIALRYTVGQKSKIHINISTCCAQLEQYGRALYHTEEAMKDCDLHQIDNLKRQKYRILRKMKEMNEKR